MPAPVMVPDHPIVTDPIALPDDRLLQLFEADDRAQARVHFRVAARLAARPRTAATVHADAVRQLADRRAVANRPGGLCSPATRAQLDRMHAVIMANEVAALAYAGRVLREEQRARGVDTCWCVADGEPPPPVVLDVRPLPCRCDLYLIAVAVVRRLAV